MEGVTIRRASLAGPDGRRVEQFLHANGLRMERGLEYTLVAEAGDRIVATGSIAGPVLKCFATDEDVRGQGVMATLTTLLLEEEYRRGNWHTFVYTRPHNLNTFLSLGFQEVARVDRSVVLLESGPESVRDFVATLAARRTMAGGAVAAVVVNCNPFTLGHQRLLETAAGASDWLHVFVVREDLSAFPYDVRRTLVRRGTAHIPNMTVHDGGQYVISQATFPSYFTRDPAEQVEDHAALDATIFGRYIVPALCITHRYVGHEPHCPVTSVYNAIIRRELPGYGVSVLEIPRLELNGEPISASRVREAVRLGDWAAAESMVPPTTYDYLRSAEAEPIIERIREGRSCQ